MKRALQVIATGAWCAPLITDAAFTDDGRVWAEEVAKTLGLPPGSLRVVDGDADPRTGQLVEDPNTTAPEIAPAPSKLDAILDILATSKVLPADEKAALEALR